MFYLSIFSILAFEKLTGLKLLGKLLYILRLIIQKGQIKGHMYN